MKQRFTDYSLFCVLVAGVVGGSAVWIVPSLQHQVLLRSKASLSHSAYIAPKQAVVHREGRSDTGFVTLKPKHLDDLGNELTAEHILYEPVKSLGLLRVKEADLDHADHTKIDPLVAVTQPEVVYAIARTPNDPQYSSQAAVLSLVQADSAWNSQIGASNTLVAVLDTGIRGTHPDLSAKMIPGYDFVHAVALAGTENSDDEGHGTIVAGIIAASTDNGVGMAGIDWSARLMPIKVIKSDGTGTDTDVAQGLRWAVDHDARIVNMSFGGGFSQTLKDQIDYAWAHGVLMAGASGNGGTEASLYPASWDEVMDVGSVSNSLAHSSFSNYSNSLDITAPGENIISTTFDGGYGTASGTSVATPFVSGAMALMQAQNPLINQTKLYDALKNSARDIGSAGYDTYTGYGLLQIRSALAAYTSYRYDFVSQNAYPNLAPGESYNFVLRLKNTGSTTWDQSIVHLATDRGRDRVPFFAREGGSPSGWVSPNRIKMQESSVAPGGIATFSFWMRNDTASPGMYREYFRPVADGAGWMDDLGIYWDVTALSALGGYRYQFVSQDSHSVSLARGQAHQFSLTVTNTGSTTWTKGVVNLGTDRPADRIPSFTREGDRGSVSGWVSGNRVTVQQSSVAPGENATFVFWLRNDSHAAGTSREYFRLVADGLGWMSDYGIFWDITSL